MGTAVLVYIPHIAFVVSASGPDMLLAHPASATHSPKPLNPAEACTTSPVETCTTPPAPACRRSHPAVLHHLRTSGERLLLLGHRSKWETVVIPDDVADVVVVLESLPYTVRRLLLAALLLAATFAACSVYEPQRAGLQCASTPLSGASQSPHRSSTSTRCRAAGPSCWRLPRVRGADWVA